MGCSNSRDNRCEEERKLFRFEGDLCFQNFGVVHGHYALMRFSKGLFMNDYGFEQVAEVCSIRSKNSRENNSIESFFTTFRTEDGSFNAHDLKLLNILMASGVAIEKAPILFDTFDDTFTGELSRATVETMAREIVQMSTIRVLQLVPDSDRVAVSLYLKELRLVESEVQQQMVQIACEEQQTVTRAKFVASMTKGDGSKILSATGVRKMMDELKNKQASKEPQT